MKIGVLTFGYENFEGFEKEHKRTGLFDINIGDNMQSLAARSLLRSLGVPDDDIISINRDTLSQYSGPPVALVMNAVFPAHSFPIPEQVKPVFVGFFATEKVVAENCEYLRKHGPIGCRDLNQCQVLARHGIEAEVTGCLTLGFPQRESPPAVPKMFVIYGSGVGGLQANALRFAPDALLQSAEFVYQRWPAAHFPLMEEDRIAAERQAERLLERYRQQATLVLTPLHHAAAPCMALGIPVIMVREKTGGRFSYLKRLTHIYTPGEVEQINWAPPPVDLGPAKTILSNALKSRLAAAGISL